MGGEEASAVLVASGTCWKAAATPLHDDLGCRVSTVTWEVEFVLCTLQSTKGYSASIMQGGSTSGLARLPSMQ